MPLKNLMQPILNKNIQTQPAAIFCGRLRYHYSCFTLAIFKKIVLLYEIKYILEENIFYFHFLLLTQHFLPHSKTVDFTKGLLYFVRSLRSCRAEYASIHP